MAAVNARARAQTEEVRPHSSRGIDAAIATGGPGSSVGVGHCPRKSKPRGPPKSAMVF
jgi:hypothetical protein